MLLPFRLDDFIRESVRPAGQQWIKRFEACLANAKSVRYATEDEYLGDDTLYVYCSRLGMGLSVLASQHLFAPIEQIVVWDGRPASGNAGTAIDVDIWRETGRPQTIIAITPEHRSQPPESPPRSAANGRRSARAMLFGIEPSNGWMLTGVGVSMAILGLAASWFPARRATLIDPMAALRE